MIVNDRQYRNTKAEVGRFEVALAHADEQCRDLDPLLHKAMRESLERQVQELREELAEYGALQGGQVASLELSSLAELPDALIRGRIASGLTQKDLAARLGLKEQQIQRYEATRYASASLARIQQVADGLGLQIVERVTLPTHGTTAMNVDDPTGPDHT